MRIKYRGALPNPPERPRKRLLKRPRQINLTSNTAYFLFYGLAILFKGAVTEDDLIELVEYSAGLNAKTPTRCTCLSSGSSFAASGPSPLG